MTDHGLNLNVAQDVMGLPCIRPGEMEPEACVFNYGDKIHERYETPRGDWLTRPWNPVSSISDSWRVLEAMRAKGWGYVLTSLDKKDFVRVRLLSQEGNIIELEGQTGRCICLAALAASKSLIKKGNLP